MCVGIDYVTRWIAKSIVNNIFTTIDRDQQQSAVCCWLILLTMCAWESVVYAKHVGQASKNGQTQYPLEIEWIHSNTIANAYTERDQQRIIHKCYDIDVAHCIIMTKIYKNEI